jgi:hypothetical protein
MNHAQRLIRRPANFRPGAHRLIYCAGTAGSPLTIDQNGKKAPAATCSR